MNKLSSIFYRISTGWVTLISLIIFLVFSSMTLPVESARVDAYAQGLGSPDTSLFYNGTMMLKMAEAYGEAGRAAFLHARWTFDLAFPFIYTLFYITSISFLFNKGLDQSSRFKILNVIPLLGLFFDLAENTATSAVMAAYPANAQWGLILAPVFTPVKWFFNILSVLLIFIGLLLWLKKGLKNSSKVNN